MVRTVITPENTNIHLSIPENYVGKTIEITFLSLEELEQHFPVTLGDFWGILSEEEALQLSKHTQQARKEWNRDF
ncbi:MAG: hypothetical protein LBL94_01205 [Prevotellaceae bacterium]|jgi:hypothetical protein|nr:hypothetical protein [Prevotellaceae bacterium]